MAAGVPQETPKQPQALKGKCLGGCWRMQLLMVMQMMLMLLGMACRMVFLMWFLMWFLMLFRKVVLSKNSSMNNCDNFHDALCFVTPLERNRNKSIPHVGM